MQGKAVQVLKADDLSVEFLKKAGNGALQFFVGNHPELSQVSQTATATLRLTTVLNPFGEPVLRGGYLRLGRIGESHIHSGTQIRVPVDLGSGRIATYGFLPNWRQIDKHPDSRNPFPQIAFPNFDQCVRTVIDQHRSIPYVQSIGWDLAVGPDNGIYLLEWNGYHNDIKFSEATQGPCFKDLGWDELWRSLDPNKFDLELNRYYVE